MYTKDRRSQVKHDVGEGTSDLGYFFGVVVVCYQKQRQTLPVYIHCISIFEYTYNMYCNYICMFLDIQVFDWDDPRNIYILCAYSRPQDAYQVYLFHFGHFCRVPNIVVPLVEIPFVFRSPQTSRKTWGFLGLNSSQWILRWRL